ncbi:hypothetical protein RsTz2092_09590 [Deferribacterales bacterium RsTz2092]
MDNEVNYEALLKHVYELGKRYDEIARLSGENFNVFNKGNA